MNPSSDHNSVSSCTRRKKQTLVVAIVLLIVVAGLLLSDRYVSSHGLAEAERLVQAWDLIRAEEILERLRVEDPGDIETVRLHAKVALARGELREARILLSALRQRDTLFAFSHALNLGFAYFYLGRLDSAAFLGQEVFTHASITSDTLLLSQSSNLLGLVAFNQGEYDKAFAFQTRSLEFASRVQSLKSKADAMRQLGVLAWYHGRHDSALTAFYRPALSLYERVGDRIGEATTLSNIGLIFHDWQEYEQNLRHQLKALEIRRRIGDQRGLADSYYFLTFNVFGKSGGAFRYAYRMKSLELSTRIGYAWGREVAARSLEERLVEIPELAERRGAFKDSMSALSGEGRLYSIWSAAYRELMQKNWPESIRLTQTVIRLCDSLGYETGKQVAVLQYARALLGAGRPDEAEEMLQQIYRKRGKDWRIGLEYVETDLARLYVHSNRAKKAQSILFPLTSYYDSLYRATLQKGNPTIALEEAAKAVYGQRSEAYDLLIESLRSRPSPQVFDFIERERSLPFWGGARTQEDGAREGTSFSAFARLLEEFDERPDRFDDINRLHTMAGELYNQASIEQQIVSSVVGKSETPDVVTLPQVQSALQTNEVLLEYYVGDSSATLIAIRNNRSKRFMIEVPELRLHSIVDVLYDGILRGKDNPRDDLWFSPAAYLHELLVSPAIRDGFILPGDHVIISPHDILNCVPFHVLVSSPLGTERRFFSDDVFLSTVPSASFLVHAREKPLRPNRSYLSVAPVSGKLPSSEKEVTAIPDNLFHDRTALVGSSATASRILEGFRQYDAVHIASHALMNQSYPLYSFIESADRKLELHELLSQKTQASLVILSACNTGVSMGAADNDPTSDDMVSFPRALLASGVLSVVASLWLVEDESEAQLVHSFFEQLSRIHGQSASDPFILSKALTIAQREFRASGNPRSGNPRALSHPFYWASLYLHGDSRF